MKVKELIGILQVLPQEHKIVIREREGEKNGLPVYWSVGILGVRVSDPDNGEVGLYTREKLRFKPLENDEWPKATPV